MRSDPCSEKVLATGEGVWQEDQLLPMHRHGYTEVCYFNFTFSPIRGENGSVEGIFNAVVETTFRVIGERRERTLRKLAEQVAAVHSEEAVFEVAVDLLGKKPEDIPFCVFYRFSEDGKTPRLAGVAGTDAEPLAALAFDPLDGERLWPAEGLPDQSRSIMIENVLERLGMPIMSRARPEQVERAVIVPFGAQGSSGTPAGYLIAGISPRRALDDDYKAFIQRAASHVGTAIANVRAFEEERSRTAALAEIDRAKTAFFSYVSDEFRKPLTLMLGPLEEALDDSKNLIPRERERIEIVHRNGLRLLKLVNSLLDFSRIEAGRAQANVERLILRS